MLAASRASRPPRISREPPGQRRRGDLRARAEVQAPRGPLLVAPWLRLLREVAVARLELRRARALARREGLPDERDRQVPVVAERAGVAPPVEAVLDVERGRAVEVVDPE